MWIDSHCHLDAPEFDADRAQAIVRAKKAGVRRIVMPAVAPANFQNLIALAHQEKQPYALGIHPLWMGQDQATDALYITQLKITLTQQQDDPYLVAIGEIGLDYFVPELDKDRQWFLYTEQLKLAKAFALPVILHVRRSADMLLKGLRQIQGVSGIAHAFNGSEQQAQNFIDLGFKLGFGGAATFERAAQIRRLIECLPLKSIVIETDAPDMPPHWIYRTAQERAQGTIQKTHQARNEPAELARIAAEIALLRGLTVEEFAHATVQNTLQALPKLSLLNED